ncbi:hypothetical protein KVM23_03195 [Helicobacter pylori]|nr:hypothetical protein KVM23_03195 [Helicobacter pylori]
MPKNIFSIKHQKLASSKTKQLKPYFLEKIKEQLNEQKHHQNTLKRTLVLNLF